MVSVFVKHLDSPAPGCYCLVSTSVCTLTIHPAGPAGYMERVKRAGNLCCLLPAEEGAHLQPAVPTLTGCLQELSKQRLLLSKRIGEEPASGSHLFPWGRQPRAVPPSSPLCPGLLAGSQQGRTSPWPDIVRSELFSEVVVLIVLPVWASTFCRGLLDAVMVGSYPWGWKRMIEL